MHLLSPQRIRLGLPVGWDRFCEKYCRLAHPIKVPAIPISTVAIAPPGSRPGITALAAKPTTVPNPIQVNAKLQ